MSPPVETVGYMIDGFDLEFKKKSFLLKAFEEHGRNTLIFTGSTVSLTDLSDVDIRIEVCGICGTDVHSATGKWGPQSFPLCVGHEIVGVVVNTGSKVTVTKLGQRVGVGAQVYSCGTCKQCNDGNEAYCSVDLMHTFGSKWAHTGQTTHGGLASEIRVNENFVYPIPDPLESKHAAPMLCAGVTAYSPLVMYGSIRGCKVGIVGIGAIGHFAILWAKALGAAEVWGISRSRAKGEDARALGCDGFIATNEAEWNEPHKLTFDMIINCASSLEGFEVDRYLSMLDVRGKFITVGIPGGQAASTLHLNIFTLIGTGALCGVSHIGSRKQILEMLQLAADKGIKPWLEETPISAEGLRYAMQRMANSEARYKICMTGFHKEFQ